MKGIMPQEIEVWYILPALRKEFTKIMVEKGLTQKEVAKKLFITEAAVSQYLRGKRAGAFEFNDKIKPEIRSSVERVLQTGNIIQEFQILCRKIRESGFLCDIHKKHGITTEECNESIICLEK